MLKRLRTAHPIAYCISAELVFLGGMFLVSFVLTIGMLLTGTDFSTVDGYLLSCVQELAGALLAVFFLARTGRGTLLTRRGCGFFNGLLVGMYPLGLICYNLYAKLMFGRPDDKPMRTGTQIFWYFAAMLTIGLAEELLFRGVIAQTLLEHFGASRSGIWKACVLSGLFFGGAHLTNLLSSAPFGVLMQCIFAASLGVLYAALYFRTGNLWVLIFLHGLNDASSLLIGGLYGTETVASAVSGYDPTMLFSVFIYVLPAAFLLRKKKIGEVSLYFGRDLAKPAPAAEEP